MLTFMLFYCWQKSRNSRVFWCVKFLAQKSGRVKFLTNFKSGASLLLTNEKAVFCKSSSALWKYDEQIQVWNLSEDDIQKGDHKNDCTIVPIRMFKPKNRRVFFP